MRIIPLLVLSLLLSLVEEVHCQQTFPYVSFGLTGQALADHSYVDISLVGRAGDNSDGVVCHSDLGTCCDGPHYGDWYFPNGPRLTFYGPIFEGRATRIAVIRCTTATGPTGIYRCDIATNAVHNNTDISVRDTVYVGLYPAYGGITTFFGAEFIAPLIIYYHCRNNHSIRRSGI